MSKRKSYYLNSSSTNYEKTGQFNMSDVLYEENKRDRIKVEQLENRIKKIIGAPEDAIVIFNSGATESIATCIHWAKCVIPHGTVVGTRFDHVAVKENCKNYKLSYESLEHPEDALNDRVNCIFITHAASFSGELYDIDSFVHNMNSYQYLQRDHSDFTNMNYNKVLQYKPIKVLDVSQSIMKVPIKMDEWDFDAVFWSNHKLGGHMGNGVLVIKQSNYKFVPLVAGAQNHGLRGGSQSAQTILQDAHIYEHEDDINSRKNQWRAAKKYFESEGINVYTPKGNHLYNTILLDTDSKCPFVVLEHLAKQKIYVSPKSACMAEQKMNESESKNKSGNDWKQIEGGEVKIQPFDNSIRISFQNGADLDDHVLKQIVRTLRESFTHQ